MNLSHYPQTPLADYAPTLIHLLRPFPAVRFMNWQQINIHSEKERPLVCTHEDMPGKDWEYQAGPWSAFCGVPIERMIDIANMADARPWICIPIAASEHLIGHIIEHAVEGATHKPIIEFANEIWNAAFWQHRYAGEQGQAAGLADNSLEAALKWQAMQTRAIKAIAGDSAEIVVAAQFFNPNVAHTLLQHCGDAADALAVAPYLGRNQHGLNGTRNRTPDEIHAEVRAEIDGDVASHVRDYKALCDKHGVALYAYEGGLHQVARNWDPVKNRELPTLDFERNKAIFTNYNRGPLAADNTAHLWQTWQANGGELFCPYSLATVYENVWTGDLQNQFFGHCEIRGKTIQLLPKYHAATEAIQKI